MTDNYTKHLILKHCTQPRSLEYLSKRLNGADPVTIKKHCQELEMQDALRQQDDLWLVEGNAQTNISELLNPHAQLYLKKFMGDFDTLKKPHPLDFEWRNTKESVNYLTDLLLKFNNPDDRILILGMPTLFASICKRDIPNQVTIVERNAAVTDTLKELSHKNCKVIVKDIFTASPDSIGLYKTVVMDPPWYEPHFFQFIWLASQCLQLGGKLIISIPPINTRPGIGKQRIDWFAFCQNQGLCLESLFPSRLEYAMPFFEWNAFRVSGVSLSPFWRKGDVAIFEKMEMSSLDRPIHEQEAVLWHEIEIATCRVRIKLQEDISDDEGDIEIRNLVPRDILGTVSNRDPIRQEANIWTSGNRIFKTNQPRKLFTFLRDYKEGLVDKTEVRKTMFEFIELISGFETNEYNDYLEWLYYEMERES